MYTSRAHTRNFYANGRGAKSTISGLHNKRILRTRIDPGSERHTSLTSTKLEVANRQ
jgi:hypothetical protein